MFWDRFYGRCVAVGIKPNPLCKNLGISSGAVAKWKSENILPTGENLCKLADALQCSVDYLLGRSDVVSVSSADDLLSSDEALLLDRYSRLDNDRKEILRAWALELALGLDRGSGNLENKKPASDQTDAG